GKDLPVGLLGSHVQGRKSALRVATAQLAPLLAFAPLTVAPLVGVVAFVAIPPVTILAALALGYGNASEQDLIAAAVLHSRALPRVNPRASAPDLAKLAARAEYGWADLRDRDLIGGEPGRGRASRGAPMECRDAQYAVPPVRSLCGQWQVVDLQGRFRS